MMPAPALKPQCPGSTSCPAWPAPAEPPLQGASFGYRLHNGDEAARQLALRAMLESGGNVTRFRRLIERAEGAPIGRRTPYQWLQKFAPLRWARAQACRVGPRTTADDLLAYPCEQALAIVAEKVGGKWEARLSADWTVIHRTEGEDQNEAIERLIAALGSKENGEHS